MKNEEGEEKETEGKAPKIDNEPKFETELEAISYYTKEGDGKAMKAWVDISRDVKREAARKKIIENEL